MPVVPVAMPVIAVTVTRVVPIPVPVAITIAIPVPIFHHSCTGCSGVFDLSSAHRRCPGSGNHETGETETYDGSKNSNAQFSFHFQL